MSEALSGLAYSLLGFVIGYIIGKAGAEVHDIKEVVAPGHHPAHEAKPTPRKQGLMHAITKSRGVGVVLILLALVTVLLSTLTAIDLRDQAQCRDRYNTRFFQAYVTRSKAADADRNSFNQLLYALNDPDPAKRRVSYQKYVDETKQTDAQRKKNPLPNPPDPTGFCQNK
jgi:hypothetical protein